MSIWFVTMSSSAFSRARRPGHSGVQGLLLGHDSLVVVYVRLVDLNHNLVGHGLPELGVLLPRAANQRPVGVPLFSGGEHAAQAQRDLSGGDYHLLLLLNLFGVDVDADVAHVLAPSRRGALAGSDHDALAVGKLRL